MRSLAWLAIIPVLALVGCTQIDQRSDDPDKKVLVAIEAPIQIYPKWRVDTGDGVDRSDVKLLLARSGKNLYTVDTNGHVLALTEKTGKQIWKTDLNATVSAGPAVGEGKLIVATNNGKVIAVDLDNGKTAWVSTSTSEILATPKIAENVVLIHTMDGGLSALSLLDGRQLWRFTHNLPPLMLRRSSTPEVKDDMVFAGFANGKLLALRKNDGSVVWSQDISHPKGNTDLQRMVDISADPVIKDDRVYAASYQGNIAALTLNNGHLLWERAIPSYSGFALDKNMIYVAATNGDLVALDQQTGATYWLVTDLQGRRLSRPAVMGKYLIVADDDGIINWIDKSSGKFIGRYELDREGVEATPVVDNKTVYILGRSGELIALEVD
jgi:outer membrane protein assembly factor BamB